MVQNGGDIHWQALLASQGITASYLGSYIAKAAKAGLHEISLVSI